MTLARINRRGRTRLGEIRNSNFRFVSDFKSAVLILFLLYLGSLRAETLLLTGATVHTVSGEVLSPGDVLVENGKIAGVGSNLNAAGATKVDLSGLHVYPGMISLNTALGLTEIEAVRATADNTETGDFTPDVESWIAANPDSELIPV